MEEIYIDELYKFIGLKVTEECLIGRGYFHCKGHKIISAPATDFPDYDWSDDVSKDDEDSEIKCESVLNYIAKNLDDECWFTAFPYECCDCGREAYYILSIKVEKRKEELVIADIESFIRVPEQMCGGMISMPGMSTIESEIFSCGSIPDSYIHELDCLTKNRFIPNGFSLIGKKMPADKSKIHCNPPYSLAKNSGYRNTYWHISLRVDENDMITAIDYSTYEAEHSMFCRPHIMYSDIIEFHKSLLFFTDQYSEDEFALNVTQQ